LTLIDALRALRSTGTLLVEFEGRRYRLVIRDGLIRMVLDETEAPKPLPPREAVELLKRLASLGQEIPAVPSPVEYPVRPPSMSILVEKEALINAINA